MTIHYELRTSRNAPVMRFTDPDSARKQLAERAPRYGNTLRLIEVRTTVVEREIAS